MVMIHAFTSLLMNTYNSYLLCCKKQNKDTNGVYLGFFKGGPTGRKIQGAGSGTDTNVDIILEFVKNASSLSATLTYNYMYDDLTITHARTLKSEAFDCR